MKDDVWDMDDSCTESLDSAALAEDMEVAGPVLKDLGATCSAASGAGSPAPNADKCECEFDSGRKGLWGGTQGLYDVCWHVLKCVESVTHNVYTVRVLLRCVRIVLSEIMWRHCNSMRPYTPSERALSPND